MSPAFLEAFCEVGMLDGCIVLREWEARVTHVHGIASGRLFASVAFCESLNDGQYSGGGGD